MSLTNVPCADSVGRYVVVCFSIDCAESGRESHLSVETHYHPAGGPFGPLLDLTLHRPHRRQAFRDALWRLKLLIEKRDRRPRRRGTAPSRR